MSAVQTAPLGPGLKRRSSTQRSRPDAIVFGLLTVIALAYIMAKARGNNFFYDEWGWIEWRRSGLHSILASYNQHLLAVPLALYQFLFHTVGLRHYWIYRLFEAVAHIGCATCVFLFARRRVGAAALLLAVPVLFLGVSWEFLLEGVNFGFVASIALSVAALLELERCDRNGDARACALLVVALACSEFTLAFMLGIAVELLWRRGRLRYVWIWGVPLALYVLWWLAYHEPSKASSNLTAAPAYAIDLAASAVGGLFGLSIDWGRPLLVAGLALLAWRLRNRNAMTPRLAGLLVAAAMFWFLVALGRAQLGDPEAARYVYTGAVLIVLIAAEAMRGAHMSREAVGVVVLAVLFALAGNIKALGVGENSLRVASRTVSAALGALELSRATAPLSTPVDPHYAPVVFAGQYFAAIDALKSSPADSPSQILKRPADARTAADGVLQRGLDIQVGRGVQRPTVGATAPVVEAVAVGAASVRGACVDFKSGGSGAALDLFLPKSGLELKATAGPPVAVRARRFASQFAGDPLVTLMGGETVVVNAAVDRSELPWHVRISPFQSVLACGL